MVTEGKGKTGWRGDVNQSRGNLFFHGFASLCGKINFTITSVSDRSHPGNGSRGKAKITGRGAIDRPGKNPLKLRQDVARIKRSAFADACHEIPGELQRNRHWRNSSNNNNSTWTRGRSHLWIIREEVVAFPSRGRIRTGVVRVYTSSGHFSRRKLRQLGEFAPARLPPLRMERHLAWERERRLWKKALVKQRRDPRFYRGF